MFDGSRASNPRVFEKLTPVAGDITLAGLGISAPDVAMLCDNVNVVFHSAATIKFNEDLKSAVEMNLRGTKRMLDLARQMRRLEVIFSFLLFVGHFSLTAPSDLGTRVELCLGADYVRKHNWTVLLCSVGE